MKNLTSETDFEFYWLFGMQTVQELMLSFYCYYNTEGNSQLNASNVQCSGTVKSHLLAITF